jgi:hypothetical protein
MVAGRQLGRELFLLRVRGGQPSFNGERVVGDSGARRVFSPYGLQ